MIDLKRNKHESRAVSNLALILVLSVVIIEVIAAGLIISYVYDNSRLTSLSVTVIGCDYVEVTSNNSSTNLIVHNLHSGSANFPINSRVTVEATPLPNNIVFGWYVIGSGENESNQGNNYLLTLGGNSSVGVACG